MIRQGFGQGLGNDWASLGNGLDKGYVVYFSFQFVQLIKYNRFVNLFFDWITYGSR